MPKITELVFRGLARDGQREAVRFHPGSLKFNVALLNIPQYLPVTSLENFAFVEKLIDMKGLVGQCTHSAQTLEVSPF